METQTHMFTLAGLGMAPFRIIGSAERTFQAAPGEPIRAGGCCKYCGTGIRYAIVVASADGKTFDVGCECVRKVDPILYAEHKEWLRAERSAIRAQLRADAIRGANERRKREAEERAARNVPEFAENEPELWARVQFLLGCDGFARDYALRILNTIEYCADVSAYGDKEDREEKSAKISELYLERTAIGHIGTVGKRETLRVQFIGVIAFDTQFGVQRLYKFAHTRVDGTVAIIVWKTQSGIGYDLLGKEINLTGTVKEHGAYNGVAQTSMLRVKVAAL